MGSGTDEVANHSGKLIGLSVLALILVWPFAKVHCVLSMKVYGLCLYLYGALLVRVQEKEQPRPWGHYAPPRASHPQGGLCKHTVAPHQYKDSRTWLLSSVPPLLTV